MKGGKDADCNIFSTNTKCINKNPVCLDDDRFSFGKTACTKWTPGINCLKTDNKGNETKRDKKNNLLGKKGTKCIEWDVVDIPIDKPSLSSNIKNAVFSSKTKPIFVCTSSRSLCGKEPECLADDSPSIGRTACLKWPKDIQCYKTDNKGNEEKKDTFGHFLGKKGMKCVEWISPDTNFVNGDEVLNRINNLKEKYTNLKVISAFEGICTDNELFINTVVSVNNNQYKVCIKLLGNKK